MQQPLALVTIVTTLLASLALAGCAATEEDNSGNTAVAGVPGGLDGRGDLGGASITGGAVGAGGSTAATVGTPGTGGSSALGTGGAAPGQGGNNATGGTPNTGGATTAVAPTWSEVWTNYFEPACASCHANSATVGSRRVFANARQMCTYLTTAGQLNGTTSPALISSSQSILSWFNTRGSMPEGNRTVPANAVNDIKAWAAAGAVCP